jgi:hypothetical protein
MQCHILETFHPSLICLIPNGVSVNPLRCSNHLNNISTYSCYVKVGTLSFHCMNKLKLYKKIATRYYNTSSYFVNFEGKIQEF